MTGLEPGTCSGYQMQRYEWKRRPKGTSPIPVGGCHYGTFLLVYSKAGGLAPHHLLAILRTPPHAHG